MMRAYHVGVIGAGDCGPEEYCIAEGLGHEIGKRGWIMICGGLGGVMEAAAKGCSAAGGTTVGILPGDSKDSANPHIRIPIATALGEGRNFLVVRASDLLLAIGGGYGTLSEIALALKMEKPVIGLRTWPDIPGVHYVRDLEEARRMLVRFV